MRFYLRYNIDIKLFLCKIKKTSFPKHEKINEFFSTDTRQYSLRNFQFCLTNFSPFEIIKSKISIHLMR